MTAASRDQPRGAASKNNANEYDPRDATRSATSHDPFRTPSVSTVSAEGRLVPGSSTWAWHGVSAFRSAYR